MDSRTIESRLREVTKGADMISIIQIMRYTGMSREWVNRQLRLSALTPIGTGRGQRYHIRDISKMLGTN